MKTLKKLSLILVGLLTLVVAAVALVGCGGGTDQGGGNNNNNNNNNNGNNNGNNNESKFEIAMITDVGDIDDKSFNQGTWEGVKKYAEENNKTYKYYRPQRVDNEEYLRTIDLAIKNGAKIVVAPGFLFEVPIFNAQKKYPNVKFVLIDSRPSNGDYEGDFVQKTESNTVSVMFAEEQGAFLAGYAAVKEGITKLGFIGGMAVPAVVAFGTGFIHGAYYAAKEAGLTNFRFDLSKHYAYLGGFAPSDDAKTKATTYFNEVDAIHFAAGGANTSGMAAAEELTDKWVIGCDVDQAAQSNRVLTSAYKNLGGAVEKILGQFYAGNFPGGQDLTLDATENGAGLPLVDTSWRFKTFTKEQYNTIYEKLVNKEIVVPRTGEGLKETIAALQYEGVTISEDEVKLVNGQ